MACRLYRNLHVWTLAEGGAPLARAMQTRVPDEFFQLSIDELKQQQRQMTETAEKELQLRTQAMRQADRAQPIRNYRFALMRVRMPGAIMLQGSSGKEDGKKEALSKSKVVEFIPSSLYHAGTFHTTDSLAALYRMAREALVDESLPFQLVTHPDRKPLQDSGDITLKASGLVPTAIVNFVCPTNPNAALKPVILHMARRF